MDKEKQTYYTAEVACRRLVFVDSCCRGGRTCIAITQAIEARPECGCRAREGQPSIWLSKTAQKSPRRPPLCTTRPGLVSCSSRLQCFHPSSTDVADSGTVRQRVCFRSCAWHSTSGTEQPTGEGSSTRKPHPSRCCTYTTSVHDGLGSRPARATCTQSSCQGLPSQPLGVKISGPGCIASIPQWGMSPSSYRPPGLWQLSQATRA